MRIFLWIPSIFLFFNTHEMRILLWRKKITYRKFVVLCFWFNNNIYVYFKYVGLLSFEHVNRMPRPPFVFWISLTNRLLQVYQFNFLTLLLVFSNTHECFEITLVFTRVHQYPWFFWNLLVFSNTHEFF